MADLSKVKINGTDYDLKDAVARKQVLQVNFTSLDGETWTADKTNEEIYNAFNSGSIVYAVMKEDFITVMNEIYSCIEAYPTKAIFSATLIHDEIVSLTKITILNNVVSFEDRTLVNSLKVNVTYDDNNKPIFDKGIGEVYRAKEAGIYVYAQDTFRMNYPCTVYSGVEYIFETDATNNLGQVIHMAMGDHYFGEGTWEKVTLIEDSNNKVISISSSSTDDQYPSAKCVYDALATKQNVIDSSHKLPASNVSGLATVATSGSYNDLTDKPANDIQTIDMLSSTLDKTTRTLTNSTLIQSFAAIDPLKPVILKNFYYKNDFSNEIDYTTTSAQSIIYYSSSDNAWKQEIKIFNYRNYQITITDFGGNLGDIFDSYIGTTIPQNSELLLTYTFSAIPASSSTATGIVYISYEVDSEPKTADCQFTYQTHPQHYVTTLPSCVERDYENGFTTRSYKLLAGMYDALGYISLTFTTNGSTSSVSYSIIDESETDMTRIDMCKFTFKYKRRSSSSELGAKLANQLISADSRKQIMIYDFRLISTDNPSTNTCILSSVSDEGSGSNLVRNLSGVTTYNNISYTIYITVNTTNIQEYRLVSNGVTKIPMSGLNITTSQKESRTFSYYNSLINPLFGAAEDYRTISSERVVAPIVLYGFKFLSSSGTRNNNVDLQYISNPGSVSSNIYAEKVSFYGYYSTSSSNQIKNYKIDITAERNDEITLRRYSSRDSGSFKAWRFYDTEGQYVYVYTEGAESPVVGSVVYSDTDTNLNIGEVVSITSSTRIVASFGRIAFKATEVTTNISRKEDKTNKVISISSSSTDDQYPSAKCVYDALATKQNVIDSSHKLPASNVSGLATVATSGNYNDLSNKPTIPSAGMEPYPVTISGSGSSMTADKTNAEIYAAVTAGKYVYAVRYGQPYKCTYAISTEAHFTEIDYESSSRIYVFSYKIVNDVVTEGTSQRLQKHINDDDMLPAEYVDYYAGNTNVESALSTQSTQIANINAKIPTEATSSNQLADKSYVGTQISAHHDSTKQDTISDLATIRSNASSGASKISCTDEAVGGYGYTKNTGTITGINMNGASKGTSGVVDLGTVLTSHQDISGKENASNKVTSISSASTDTQYPSAKCVYDLVGNIEAALAALR